MASAAFVNGFASNVLDFDDMHVPTLIHPTGTVVAAARRWRWRKHNGRRGGALLDAVAIGIEVELHIGRCLFPGHYDQGWHITATAGVIGAAAAASALMGAGPGGDGAGVGHGGNPGGRVGGPCCPTRART